LKHNTSGSKLNILAMAVTYAHHLALNKPLELELIRAHMAQKQVLWLVLWVEVGAHAARKR
jgi:hypothetical protein